MVFKILEFRLSKNMSQEELSKKSNVKTSTISDIENNRVEPSFSKILKISKALDVNMYDLIDCGEKFYTQPPRFRRKD